jgi:transcriptional regulator with XRE-family HTH domain
VASPRFGAILRDARKARRIPIGRMAAAVGVTKGYISGIERSRVAPPRERVLRRLARALGLPERPLAVIAFLEKAPPRVRRLPEWVGIRARCAAEIRRAVGRSAAASSASQLSGLRPRKR